MEFKNQNLKNELNFFVDSDAFKDGVLIVQDKIIRYSNPGAARIFGFKINELIGCDYTNHKNDGNLYKITEFYSARQSNNNADFIYETMLNHKKSTVYAEIKSTPIEYEENPSDLLIIRDITRYKQTEERLRQSECEMRTRSRIADIFLTVANEKMYGKVLEILLKVLKSKYGLFGYIDKNNDLVCPSLTKGVWNKSKISDNDTVIPRKRWGSIWKQILDEGNSLYSNNMHHVSTDHLAINRSLLVPIIDKGKSIGLLAVANKTTDYSEKDKQLLDSIAGYIGPILGARLQRDRRKIKQTKQTESLSESKFRSLFDLSPQPIALTNAKTGRFTEVNQKFYELSGYAKNKIIGRTPFELGFCSYDQMNHFIRELELLREIRGYTIDFSNKAGSIISINMFSQFIQLGGQNYVFSILIDMTEKKQLEAQLLQSQKMEAIGTLAGGIAHDFNNLLTIIIGNAELALLKSDNKNMLYADINGIIKAGNSAAALIRQLLAFSRKQNIQPEILNINNIIKNLEKMLCRLISKHIEIKIISKNKLCKVKMDPGQIEQVIINLAVNARDAMPKGGKLIIKIENVELDMHYFRFHGLKSAPGSYVMIVVKDTGEGIDETIQSRIFEPFFTTKALHKGTGLGLSTVYGIIKQNSGYIWVDSVPGQDTKFKIYLPRVESEII